MRTNKKTKVSKSKTTKPTVSDKPAELIRYSQVKYGFPDQLRLKLKYDDTLTIPLGTATTIAQYTFSANGMFDPNISAAGHQPLYFDTLMSVYDHYFVESSYIVVKLVTTNPIRFGLIMADDVNTQTSIFNLAEQSAGSSSVVNQYDGQKVFTKTWKQKVTFGQAITANTKLEGTAVANPTEQSYFILGYQGLTGVDTNIYLDCCIYFNAIFDERKQIASH